MKFNLVCSDLFVVVVFVLFYFVKVVVSYQFLLPLFRRWTSPR